MTRERAKEIQRLEKLLEDAGIKLSSVATDISGVSGRPMLDALVDGERNPAVLAELAKRRLRSKIPALIEALTGRFGEHHAFLTRLHLDVIDQHSRAIDELTRRIEVVIEPFRGAREVIVTIPGISTGVADVIIAETGADMTRFPTAAPGVLGRHLPGQQRVRRPDQVDQHPTGQLLPQRRLRDRGDVRRQQPRHLPRSQIPPGSPRAAARSKPSSRSSTPSSSRSGTCSPTASSTTTSVRTTTAGSTPNVPSDLPSTSSERWATTSPSTHSPTGPLSL